MALNYDADFGAGAGGAGQGAGCGGRSGVGCVYAGGAVFIRNLFMRPNLMLTES